MTNADPRGLLGGLLLIAMGFWFGVTSLNLRIGNLIQMGPGLYPLILSVIAVLLGVLLLLQGLKGRGEDEEYEQARWRPIMAVMGGIAAFALCIKSLGLIPAVFFTVVVCATGDRASRPLNTLVLAVICATGAWLIFRVGLNLPMPAFTGSLRWT